MKIVRDELYGMSIIYTKSQGHPINYFAIQLLRTVGNLQADVGVVAPPSPFHGVL